MKTYELFVEATEADLKAMGASASQIAMLKKRQEKRGKGFSTGDDRVKKTPSNSAPKALPGAPSSALVKRSAADKATSIVRTKRGGTGKEAIGDFKKKSGPGQRVKEPERGPGSKTYGMMNRDARGKGGALSKDLAPDTGKKLRDKVALKDQARKKIAMLKGKRLAKDAFKDAVKMTSKAGPGVAQSKDLKGAPRGIYNPK